MKSEVELKGPVKMKNGWRDLGSDVYGYYLYKPVWLLVYDHNLCAAGPDDDRIEFMEQGLYVIDRSLDCRWTVVLDYCRKETVRAWQPADVPSVECY